MKHLLLVILLLALVMTCNAQTLDWVKSMGGTNNENGFSIALDASGNVYTTGRFAGTSDFDPGVGVYNLTSTGSYDIFISKLDAAGNFVWAKAIGGPDWDGAASIALDASGNVYITGGFQDSADFDPGTGVYNLTSAGFGDIFISKLDAAGNFAWAKAMGGTSSEAGISIALDASGNVYTTGTFLGTVDFDPGGGVYNLTSAGSDDIFISKLDASGNFVWAKQMGGTSLDYGYSIALDDSGNIYTTGYFYETADFDPGVGVYNLTVAGDDDIFISKLDAAGNFAWAKAMGGTIGEYSYSIALDDSGNVYTTGVFQGTADFDPGGGVYNLTAVGGGDIFISKLDAAGNFAWAKAMGGTSGDAGTSIALDAVGNGYTTGYFRATADFDPGVGVYNLTSVGDLDIFISKLDAAGNFAWAIQMGETYADNGSSISLDATGNVYTTGVFRGTVDFDPSVGVYDLTSAGFGDIFVHKMSQSTGLSENEPKNAVALHPNPTTGKFKVSSLEFEVGEIKVFDLLGNLVLRTEEKAINLSGYRPGVYLIKIGNSTTKLILTK